MRWMRWIALVVVGLVGCGQPKGLEIPVPTADREIVHPGVVAPWYSGGYYLHVEEGVAVRARITSTPHKVGSGVVLDIRYPGAYTNDNWSASDTHGPFDVQVYAPGRTVTDGPTVPQEWLVVEAKPMAKIATGWHFKPSPLERHIWKVNPVPMRLSL